MTLMKLRLRSR